MFAATTFENLPHVREADSPFKQMTGCINKSCVALFSPRLTFIQHNYEAPRHVDYSIASSGNEFRKRKNGQSYLNLPVLRSERHPVEPDIRKSKVSVFSNPSVVWCESGSDVRHAAGHTDWLTEAHCTLFNSQAAPGSLYWLWPPASVWPPHTHWDPW